MIEMQTKLIAKNHGLQQILDSLKSRPWKSYPYSKQNWGNWLHHMSPYVGKMKPAIANILIEISSKENDVVLDPFCGIGTVPLEADLMNRVAVGVDLNPYAALIAKAKFDRRPLQEHIDWLNKISLDSKIVDTSDISDFMKLFYHPKTLKEIIVLKNILISEKRYFLLGCLLGILHGHRPGHLSAITSLVIPYRPKSKPVYKNVMSRLIEKVYRMYKDTIPLKTNGKIFNSDARNLPLGNNSVDVIITSPPYFNTLDYVQDNRVRLEFLGLKQENMEELKDQLIQDKNTYLEEMVKVGKELRRVLKPNHICIFVLGDMHMGRRVVNTAKEVADIYESIGFSTFGITKDPMPTNKAIPSSFKRDKLDRFLVMSNEK